MIPLLATLAFAADCPAPTRSADLVGALIRADAAFVAMDLDGFEAARTDAHRALDCLGEPITPIDAAWLHRVEALSAFVRDDAPLVRRSFQSSLAIQPEYRLAAGIAPPGNPIASLYAEAAALPPSATAPLPVTEQSLLVDGSRATDRPTERPIVLQGLDRSGAVDGTEWLGPGAPLPGWVLVPPPPIAERPRRHVNAPLLVASGASIVAAGGLYGFAWGSHAAWADPDTPLDKLDGLRGRTNGAVVASGVLTGVGVGLGVVAVAVPW